MYFYDLQVGISFCDVPVQGVDDLYRLYDCIIYLNSRALAFHICECEREECATTCGCDGCTFSVDPVSQVLRTCNQERSGCRLVAQDQGPDRHVPDNYLKYRNRRSEVNCQCVSTVTRIK